MGGFVPALMCVGLMPSALAFGSFAAWIHASDGARQRERARSQPPRRRIAVSEVCAANPVQ
jgi:hypothetical protein